MIEGGDVVALFSFCDGIQAHILLNHLPAIAHFCQTWSPSNNVTFLLAQMGLLKKIELAWTNLCIQSHDLNYREGWEGLESPKRPSITHHKQRIVPLLEEKFEDISSFVLLDTRGQEQQWWADGE